ncbi:hypothetical protein HHK36_016972 [Tetracentron sinense]|uniref:Phytocyanin domain-containing protein n=1 Tax=Tetracentron sinense TaxID=13715 RepID=A0A834Z6A8_TETSI|nr:hypothetical protein HHK36_016972 [Tetracentron sinense]
MAIDRVFDVLAIVAIVLPSIAMAEEFIVGDGIGWTIGFDYQDWAKGKDFLVGDKLVFQYPVGAHNVFKVNGTGFQNCIAPPQSEALTSGNDTITLATPGRKWYICGVGKHCELGGQKLFITVQRKSLAPTMAPSQALSYTSSVNEITAPIYQLLMAVTVTIASMVFL